MLPAIFRIQSGAQVIAQTVDVLIRISSLRDTDQYVDARVSLTVPPAGPPVSISVQPAMVRLVDQTEGQAHLLLDNTDSNYPRTVALTGSDDQGALEFHFSPLDWRSGRAAPARSNCGSAPRRYPRPQPKPAPQPSPPPKARTPPRRD